VSVESSIAAAEGMVRDTSHISERCQGAARLRRELQLPGSSFQVRKSANDGRCTVSGEPTSQVETAMTADSFRPTAYGWTRMDSRRTGACARRMPRASGVEREASNVTKVVITRESEPCV
jgi:hypothetical protein